MEAGEGYPDITTVPALAEVLHITTDELLNGESRPTSQPASSFFGAETTRLLFQKKKQNFYLFFGLSLMMCIIGNAFSLVSWYSQQKVNVFIVGFILMAPSLLFWILGWSELRQAGQTATRLLADIPSFAQIVRVPFIVLLWLWALTPYLFLLHSPLLSFPFEAINWMFQNVGILSTSIFDPATFLLTVIVLILLVIFTVWIWRMPHRHSSKEK